jgi:hypothetical protein
VQALIAELTAMRAADPSSKALVFSQYNSTLEWLQRRLPEQGFSFRWGWVLASGSDLLTALFGTLEWLRGVCLSRASPSGVVMFGFRF